MVTKMFLQDDGSFGIGTTSPTSKLHVIGDVATVNLKWFGSLALGSSNGTVSSGTASVNHLASDPDSFARVTGGRLLVDAAGDMNSSASEGISLYTTHPIGNKTVFLNSQGANAAGRLTLSNADTNPNCVDISSASSSVNKGYIGVSGLHFGVPAVLVSMLVDGNGDGVISQPGAKFFRVPDPDDVTRDLFYACIEGPEAAMYVRGTGRLVNGEARIEFPDHFRKLAAPQGITVILQPRGRKSRGLGVENTSPDGCTVFELKSGQGDYEFDWEVKAVRKGYENYRPVRRRNEE